MNVDVINRSKKTIEALQAARTAARNDLKEINEFIEEAIVYRDMLAKELDQDSLVRELDLANDQELQSNEDLASNEVTVEEPVAPIETAGNTELNAEEDALGDTGNENDLLETDSTNNDDSIDDEFELDLNDSSNEESDPEVNFNENVNNNVEPVKTKKTPGKTKTTNKTKNESVKEKTIDLWSENDDLFATEENEDINVDSPLNF